MPDVAFDTVVRARAPLRVDLCGGGVLNAAIARFAQATLRPLPARTTRIRSLVLDGVTDYVPDAGPAFGDERFGIVAACLRRLPWDAAAREHGLELDLASDAPLGSGLGVPSALAVAIIGAFASCDGLDLAPREIADLASQVAQGDAGWLDAAQDPYPATFGGFSLVERRGGDGVAVHPVAVDPGVVHELERGSLLAFPDAPGTPAPGPDAGDGTAALANEAAAALLEGRLDALASLLHEDWMHRRGTSASASTPQLDELYTAARAAGAHGGTGCGAGTGGYVFLVCPADRRAAVRARLRYLGARVSPVEFTSAGLRSWLQDAGEAP